MNTKVLLAALAGAVVSFLTGWAIWGIALRDFFDSNTMEGARSVMRGENMITWAIFVGCFAWSLLLALLYSRWAGITTLKAGAVAGAWISFLIALGADFFSYASMDIMTMNSVIVDAVCNGLQGAIVGGIVGWVLGYNQAK